MPFDGEISMTQHDPDLLTTVSALALYDSATTTADKLRAAAAMAHVLRKQNMTPAPKAKRPKAASEPAAAPRVFNAQNLAAALLRAKAIIPASLKYGALSGVQLIGKGGFLEIRTMAQSASTGLDEYVETLTDAEHLDGLNVIVSCADLLGTVRGRTGGVAMSAKDGPLSVEVGGASMVLPLVDEDKGMPKMGAPAKAVAFSMDADNLRSHLDFVSTAISTEETRYYLNGAYMHVRQDSTLPGGKCLTFVATDGHRMMRSYADEMPPEGFPSLLIPRAACEWLVKHLPKSGAVEILANDSRAVFTTKIGSFSVGMIDGAFPDYGRAIPSDANSQNRIVIPDAKAFGDDLKRMKADRRASVGLYLALGGLKVTAKTNSGMRIQQPVPDATSVGEEAIGFNCGYLMDMAAIGTGMLMGFEAPNTPCLVTWTDKPNRLGVLMPLRL